MTSQIAKDLANKITTDADALIERVLSLTDNPADLLHILTRLHEHIYEWLATAHIELRIGNHPQPLTQLQRQQFAEFIADQVTKSFKEKIRGPDRTTKITRRIFP